MTLLEKQLKIKPSVVFPSVATGLRTSTHDQNKNRRNRPLDSKTLVHGYRSSHSRTLETDIVLKTEEV